jgi:hypothetical protein
MHNIIYDGEYVMNCQGFYDRCINMYMCLNGTEHIYTVTVGCIWCFHTFHAYRCLYAGVSLLKTAMRMYMSVAELWCLWFHA